MILSFKEQFVEKIKQGQKVTTIRKSGRWKDGQKIHFWKGSPRNSKSNPYHFGMGKVDYIDHIELSFGKDNEDYLIYVTFRPDGSVYSTDYLYDFNDTKDRMTMEFFAIRDGFKDWNELREWFLDTYKKQIREDGRLLLKSFDLIHFKYEI